MLLSNTKRRGAAKRGGISRSGTEACESVSVEIDSELVYLCDGADAEIALSHEGAREMASMIRDQIGLGDASEDHAVLFFTDEVEADGVEYCQRQMLKLAFGMMALTDEERKGKYITLIINSPGGDLDHGMALIDTIEMVRGMGIHVVGIAMGAAYSMAAVILQACTKRLVGRHARVMLHEVSTGAEGKGSEIRELMKEIEVVNAVAAGVFAERNTAGRTETQGWIDFMVGTDKYLSPRECVEMGLADAVYEPLKMWRVEI